MYTHTHTHTHNRPNGVEKSGEVGASRGPKKDQDTHAMAPYAHRYGVRVVCHLGPSLAPTHTLCLCPSKSRATSAWVCSCGVCAPLEYAWCCLPVWSCRSTRVRSSVCQRCVCVCLCVSVCQRCVCVCVCVCAVLASRSSYRPPPFLQQRAHSRSGRTRAGL